MNDFYHGGNLREAQDKYGICKKKIIDFSASINPSGMPSGIRRLISRNICNIVNYPDPYNKSLVEALSEKHNISMDDILIGNGSNELIYLIINSLSPKKVLIPVPSYGEYERASLAADSCCVFSNLLNDDKFYSDLQNIINDLDESIGLIFICNPHNPTGSLWNKRELENLINECRKTDTIVLVDEAFMAFVQDEEEYSAVNLLGSNSNLIVLRSMTKIFAIPGLRLGYLLGNKALVSRMRSKQPNWQVNSLVQNIGPHLLGDNRYLLKSKDIVSKLKDHFYQELNKFDWINPQYPSVNFIFCKLKGSVTDSKKLSEHLIKKHKILIRDCSNFRGLDKSFIRIAVKSSKENLNLIRCLKEFEKGL